MKYDPVLHVFRKAKASGGNNSNGCVEVADTPDGGALVRDSKNPDGPVLSYTAREWRIFRDAVKAGEFG